MRLPLCSALITLALGLLALSGCGGGSTDSDLLDPGSGLSDTIETRSSVREQVGSAQDAALDGLDDGTEAPVGDAPVAGDGAETPSPVHYNPATSQDLASTPWGIPGTITYQMKHRESVAFGVEVVELGSFLSQRSHQIGERPPGEPGDPDNGVQSSSGVLGLSEGDDDSSADFVTLTIEGDPDLQVLTVANILPREIPDLIGQTVVADYRVLDVHVLATDAVDGDVIEILAMRDLTGVQIWPAPDFAPDLVEGRYLLADAADADFPARLSLTTDADVRFDHVVIDLPDERLRGYLGETILVGFTPMPEIDIAVPEGAVYAELHFAIAPSGEQIWPYQGDEPPPAEDEVVGEFLWSPDGSGAGFVADLVDGERRYRIDNDDAILREIPEQRVFAHALPVDGTEGLVHLLFMSALDTGEVLYDAMWDDPTHPPDPGLTREFGFLSRQATGSVTFAPDMEHVDGLPEPLRVLNVTPADVEPWLESRVLAEYALEYDAAGALLGMVLHRLYDAEEHPVWPPVDEPGDPEDPVDPEPELRQSRGELSAKEDGTLFFTPAPVSESPTFLVLNVGAVELASHLGAAVVAEYYFDEEVISGDGAIHLVTLLSVDGRQLWPKVADEPLPEPEDPPVEVLRGFGELALSDTVELATFWAEPRDEHEPQVILNVGPAALEAWFGQRVLAEYHQEIAENGEVLGIHLRRLYDADEQVLWPIADEPEPQPIPGPELPPDAVTAAGLLSFGDDAVHVALLLEPIGDHSPLDILNVSSPEILEPWLDKPIIAVYRPIERDGVVAGIELLRLYDADEQPLWPAEPKPEDPIEPDPEDPIEPGPIEPDPEDPIEPGPIEPDPEDPIDPGPIEPREAAGTISLGTDGAVLFAPEGDAPVFLVLTPSAAEIEEIGVLDQPVRISYSIDEEVVSATGAIHILRIVDSDGVQRFPVRSAVELASLPVDEDLVVISGVAILDEFVHPESGSVSTPLIRHRLARDVAGAIRRLPSDRLFLPATPEVGVFARRGEEGEGFAYSEVEEITALDATAPEGGWEDCIVVKRRTRFSTTLPLEDTELVVSNTLVATVYWKPGVGQVYIDETVTDTARGDAAAIEQHFGGEPTTRWRHVAVADPATVVRPVDN